ncbi:type II toxin-antitoxin system VapC family toxin [Mycobacterium shinjukuense]|uniref:Ribonuclease VapC n=1 Tax=Mycobacterium shinjukuense TaxID=398694 RepID=A0A7I7MUV6_9MYCO|nr:type II toxin-antitoxin system VapC family toxin [Mycobacterium shinjukuense]MCV6984093.1 type II toxin-antitoxin system VapC family toxin [Mycobacterium shinjukuense]ORB69210.1 VapC toxin family PIN domain ribonuclease [Mycobacterium shinjukuense]BBX75662.1 ribonuclease VapC [Mycobacterium shinjukuense]
MIVLDTNVLSALMQHVPDPAVIGWLDAQPAESIWTTSITVLEVRTGIELLERGRRRKRLEALFSQILCDDLNARVLSFDQAAAVAAATVAATRRRAGQTVDIRDVQIAGIATARRAILATRNTRHFDAMGIGLVNPWD